MIATWATLDLIDQCLMSLVTNDSYLGYLISGMFGLISGMFGLISGMFGLISGMFGLISGMFGLISGMFGLISGMFGLISGMFLNKSSIEQGMRYSCYPLVVVFNILSWYRFHCRGMIQHLFYAFPEAVVADRIVMAA